MDIGNKIRKLRKNNNFTLKELSERSGLSVSFISDIENGRRIPRLENLDKLSKALNVDISYLIDRKNNKNSKDNKDGVDDDIRRIERARNKMTAKDKKKMMEILKVSFEEYFDDRDKD